MLQVPAAQTCCSNFIDWMHKHREPFDTLPPLPWPICSGGSFVDIAERMQDDSATLQRMGLDLLQKCRLLAESSTFDDYMKVAGNIQDWPISQSSAQVPILCFNIKKQSQWKFTPQCEIFPVVKSICFTKFREELYVKELEQTLCQN